MSRISTIGPETEDKLLMYFNGELSRKIKLFEKSKNRKWPDEYYYTLYSTSYVKANRNSNGISDPTGNRATKLADLTKCLSDDYFYFKQLGKTLKEVLQSLNDGDIYLIQVHLGIIKKSITEAAAELNISYSKARKKSIKLIRLLDRKISGVVVNEN